MKSATTTANNTDDSDACLSENASLVSEFADCGEGAGVFEGVVDAVTVSLDEEGA